MSVTDDFDRPDAGSLGAFWTEVTPGLKIVSNQAHAVNGLTYNAAFYNNATFPANAAQSSKATLRLLTDQGVIVRASAGPKFYMGMAHSTVGQRIYRNDNGSFSLLVDFGGSITSDDTVTLAAAADNALTYKKNDVAVGSPWTGDTTYTSGAPGIYNAHNSSSEAVDDWIGTGEAGGGGGTKAPLLSRPSPRFFRRAA